MANGGVVEDAAEHGWDHEGLCHPVALDQFQPGAGVELGQQNRLLARVQRDEQTQRAPDVEDGCRHHVHLLGGVGIDRLRVVGQPIGDHVVADEDGLRQPGGPAGEQDQGGVRAVPDRGGTHWRQRRRPRSRFSPNTGPSRAEPRFAAYRGSGHTDPGPDQLGQLGELGGGQVGIHLGAGGPQSGCRVDGGHRQCASEVYQGHPITRPDAGCGESRGDLADERFELAIGDRGAVDHDRDPVGDTLERGVGGMPDIHGRGPRCRTTDPVAAAICGLVIGAGTTPRSAAACSATGPAVRARRASRTRVG